MIHPSLEVAIEINRAVRQDDEWFDEPDDLARLERALTLTATAATPLDLAAAVLFRVAFSQAFVEGNKRTALLLAVWVMDNNGLDANALIPSWDPELAALLVDAAAGRDVEDAIRHLLSLRSGKR